MPQQGAAHGCPCFHPHIRLPRHPAANESLDPHPSFIAPRQGNANALRAGHDHFISPPPPPPRLYTVSDRGGDALPCFNFPQTPPSTLSASCLRERGSSASEARQHDQFHPSNCTSAPLTELHNRAEKLSPPTMHPLFPVTHHQPPSPRPYPAPALSYPLSSPHPTAPACACDLLALASTPPHMGGRLSRGDVRAARNGHIPGRVTASQSAED
eukprot:scaffold57858_cov28-Tisochrysis_lutea.AAC.1